MFGNFILLVRRILSIAGSNSNVDRNFSTLTHILSHKRLSLNHETMEDLVIVFVNSHLSNQSERDKTFKQVHQLYTLKRRHVQLDNN